MAIQTKIPTHIGGETAVIIKSDMQSDIKLLEDTSNAHDATIVSEHNADGTHKAINAASVTTPLVAADTVDTNRLVFPDGQITSAAQLGTTQIKGTATAGSATTLVDTNAVFDAGSLNAGTLIVERAGSIVRIATIISNTTTTFTLASGTIILPSDTYTAIADTGVALANVPKNVENIAALRADPALNAGETRTLLAHTTQGDGGGGLFEARVGAVAGTYTPDDGLVVVTAGGDGSSAWVRKLDEGVINLRFFGIYSKNLFYGQITAKIRSAVSFLITHHGAAGKIIIPHEGIGINGTIELPRFVLLEGEFGASVILVNYNTLADFKAVQYFGLTTTETVYPAFVMGGEVDVNGIVQPHSALSTNRRTVVTKGLSIQTYSDTLGAFNSAGVIMRGGAAATTVYPFGNEHVSFLGFTMSIGDYSVFHDRFIWDGGGLGGAINYNDNLAKFLLGYGNPSGLTSNGDANRISSCSMPIVAARTDYDVAFRTRTALTVTNCINGHFHARDSTQVRFENLKQEIGSFNLAVPSASFSNVEFSGHVDNRGDGKPPLYLAAPPSITTGLGGSAIYSVADCNVQRRTSIFQGGARAGTDVAMDALSILKTSDFYAPTGYRTHNQVLCPLVGDLANVAFQSWKDNAHFLSESGVTKGNGEVEFDAVVSVNPANTANQYYNNAGWRAVAAAMTFYENQVPQPWGATLDIPYYYKLQVLVTNSPPVGMTKAVEKVATVASANLETAVYIEPTVGKDPWSRCLIKLYRGTTTGVYDKVAIIPVKQAQRLFDHGDRVCHILWETRAVAGGVDGIIEIQGINRDLRQIKVTPNIVDVAGGLSADAFGTKLGYFVNGGPYIQAGCKFVSSSYSALGKNQVSIRVSGKQYGSLWQPNTALTTGVVLVSPVGRAYHYTAAGTTGAFVPTHVAGSAADGTATATFITDINVAVPTVI